MTGKYASTHGMNHFNTPMTPDVMDGMSLLPFLTGQDTPTRTDFFMEHVDVIDVENPIPDSRGVRSMEWKCMRYVNIEPEVEEMYHISLDPLESNNLVNDVKYKGIRDQMAGRYEQKYPSVLHSRAGAR